MEKEQVIRQITEQLKNGVKVKDRTFPSDYSTGRGHNYEITIMYSELVSGALVQRQLILVLRKDHLQGEEQSTRLAIIAINQYTNSGVAKSFCTELNGKKVTLTPTTAEDQSIDNYNAIIPGVVITLE